MEVLVKDRKAQILQLVLHLLNMSSVETPRILGLG